MPLDRDQPTLHDIVAAGRLIRQFIAGMDRAAFLADPKTQSAVIHQLLIIGEATKRLSDAFRSMHPEIPWPKIARTRDMLIHHYEGVDLHEVWKIAHADIPTLLAALEPLMPEQP